MLLRRLRVFRGLGGYGGNGFTRRSGATETNGVPIAEAPENPETVLSRRSPRRRDRNGAAGRAARGMGRERRRIASDMDGKRRLRSAASLGPCAGPKGPAPAAP